MKLRKTIMDALESLVANKVRSALTILGIVIGVGAVIAMLAIGNGAENSILGEIEDIGTNLIIIQPGGAKDVRNPEPLTLQDADAIADSLNAPSVAAVAPVIGRSVEVTYGRESTTTSLYGITPSYAEVRKFSVSEGEFISDTHLVGSSAVVVLGTDVAEALFGRKQGLVGETVRVQGQTYRVIGVLKQKGGSSFGSEDNQILIPLSTAQVRLAGSGAKNEVNAIFASATKPDVVQTAVDEITQILRTRHRTAYGAEDFTIMNQQDIVDVASSITGVLTIFLGGIAAISLLVGGIGIMNIMLVSVIERTREIGLRKALGARKSDILGQFLAESMLLSLFGGVLGILLGWLLSIIVEQIAVNSGTPFYPAIDLNAILLATLFSTAVGLFFGLYPANRAANLEPVEALRSE